MNILMFDISDNLVVFIMCCRGIRLVIGYFSCLVIREFIFVFVDMVDLFYVICSMMCCSCVGFR